jgi:hypothetical protein
MNFGIKKIRLRLGFFIVFLLISNAVWAFGSVDSLVGKVVAINQAGISRDLSVSSHIDVQDTIVTGNASEVLIKTDDNGIVFLEENSTLKVESFSAKGNEKDNFVINLLKGAFRGVTGFVGKRYPKHYRLYTPTATIGIRGTDYQVEIVEGVYDTDKKFGVFVKVESGKISLANRDLSIDVAAQQFAVVPKNSRPQLLDNAPVGLFKANQLDGKIESLIRRNQADESRRNNKNKASNNGDSNTSNQISSEIVSPGLDQKTSDSDKTTEMTQALVDTGITNNQGAKNLDKSVNLDQVSLLEKVEKVESVQKVEKVDKVEAVEKTEKVEKVESVQKVEKVDKVEAVEKTEKVDKVESVQKVEKVDKVEAVEKTEKVDKVESVQKVEKVDKVEAVEKTEKVNKVERVHKVEKVDKVEAVEKTEKVNKVERVHKVEKVDKAERR